MIHLHNKTVWGVERLSTVKFVVLFVALKLLVGYVFARLAPALTGNPITEGLELPENNYDAFLIIAVLAPPLETFLFQYIFFKNLGGLLSPTKIVLLSAAIFSLFHLYNVSYFTYSFFSGVLLSTSYACRIKSNPFLCTSLIHCFYNAIAFVLNHWSYS